MQLTVPQMTVCKGAAVMLQQLIVALPHGDSAMQPSNAKLL